MFANAMHASFAQRVVATLVACAVGLWSVGAFTSAQAANLINVSDTLSNSGPSETSAHTIAFTIPTGSTYDAADDFTITFEAGFTGIAASVQGDMSVTVDGVAATIDSFDSTGQVITLSLDTTANAGDEIVVAIDDGVITNPAGIQSYTIVIETVADIGNTRVAIVDHVEVSAIVQTSFDFNIYGTATSTAVNGTSTTGYTTATAIPFGVLDANVPETRAQRLTVATNALNGFVVTVETDGDLQSANGAIIDTFNDGLDVSTAGTSWVSPSNDVNDDTTWGHWGMTYDDDATQDLGAEEYVAASTTPREVFSHTGPSDGTTTNIGSTTVAYRVEITPLQEAADDYSTTLTYIATPTF